MLEQIDWEPTMIVMPARSGSWNFTLQLRGGSCETVARPHRGVHVTCRTGELWITHDGDPRDVVLEAGEGYTAERGACMMVHAVKDSQVDMEFSRIS